MSTYRITLLIVTTILLFCSTASVFSNPLSGQIIVDPSNPAWLKYSGGGPHFMAGPGDPEDFLYRGSQNANGTRNGDQLQLINKLKPTGANSIYFQAIRSHGGDGNATHNPFVNNDPNQGINTAVLNQWKTWFSEMDRNGIVIYFFFYDDGARIWNTGDNVGSAERAFIQTIVNNFKNYKNLIWVVAEEYAERYTAKRVSNIAKEIRAADNHNHVIAVHKNDGLNFSEFANDPNIDQFAIQCCNKANASKFHTDIVKTWKSANKRYNLNMSESAGGLGSGETLRKKAWATALGGAYVMGFRMDIKSSPVSDLEDMGHLVNFMESTNFNEMEPQDSLAFDATQYVLAFPGKSYIAYASNAADGTKLGIKGLTAGSYLLRWFDPDTGASTSQTVSVPAGDQSWSKPTQFGNEIALYINRKGDNLDPAPSAPADVIVQ